VTKAFCSYYDDCQIHESGWVHLDSGVEITRLPVWDDEADLFARLGPGTSAELLGRWDLRLPTVAEYNELHAAALHIAPYTMPTARMLDADGISIKSRRAIDRYRVEHMQSREWCRLHDDEVFRLLALAEWDGEPVDNAGKHWAAGGIIYGWWRRGVRKIQSPSTAHKGEPAYTDYATTFHAVRECPAAATSKPEPPSEPAPSTHIGAKGAAAKAWQQRLIGDGYGSMLEPWGADGDHGSATERATLAWYSDRGLPRPEAPVPDTLPGPPAPSDGLGLILPSLEVIASRHYTPADGRDIRNIVLHSTENPPRPGVARSVARWFSGPSAPRASCHVVCGSDEAIRCVPDAAVAWAAPGANRAGLQLEIVGQALRTEWLQQTATLERAAQICAEWCDLYGIPPSYVGPKGLREGRSGITTHWAVTDAFRRSTHVDPGGPKNRRWPMREFIAMIKR